MTVWHGHAFPALVLPPGVAAPLAGGAKAGFAEFLEDLAGRFITDHGGQSSWIDFIKSNLLDNPA